MTSDDLLTRASGRARFCRDKGGVKTPDLLDELAARIRELQEERDEAVTQMVEAKVERDKAQARIRELQAQLPEGMEHCTIEFKECEHGHGRLVATNWVDHGCHFCRIRELEAKLVNLSEFCSERERECELLWQAIDYVDTSDPQLARHACERSGLDIDKAAISAAQPDAKPKQGE